VLRRQIIRHPVWLGPITDIRPAYMPRARAGSGKPVIYLRDPRRQRRGVTRIDRLRRSPPLQVLLPNPLTSCSASSAPPGCDPGILAEHVDEAMVFERRHAEDTTDLEMGSQGVQSGASLIVKRGR
jgi:hypothetical protein